MINRIIEFSARNRFLIFLFVVAASVAGWIALKNTPLDAIPDLSDTQVIIYSKWNRSPDIIEDQVTYPIISAMLGAPRVKDIRGISVFGNSFIYVIFQDGTDPYWARSRTLEYLSKITPSLPKGVRTELGPDATGVGWVYEYALVDKSGHNSLATLRTYQDWYLRYQLESVPGVSEVATVGGYDKEYEIKLNPNALEAYHLSIQDVMKAVKNGNNEIGARVLEVAGAEYMIRGLGYVKNIRDIQHIVVASRGGIPIYVKNLGTVTIGPQMRRGVADLNGQGDVVGGVVIMRYGENANQVIQAVKQKLQEAKASFPPHVKLVTTYDRSDLIQRAVGTLSHELKVEMVIVSLVILIFLLHFPSASVPIIALPLSVLISFVPMYWMGISSNIMSLGGIAIAIGAMVDAAIVIVENSHKHLEIWKHQGKPGQVNDVIIKAVKEVGSASFYSLLVIAVAFFPIFALQGQEGRLFKPLAYTKNFSMFVAAILSITLAPALIITLSYFSPKEFKPAWMAKLRNFILVGTTYSEENHPLSRVLFKIYGPIVKWTLKYRYKVVAGAVAVLLLTIPLFFQLGSEFMPPLNEGTLLYMPTTLPGISISQAQDLLERQDQVLKSFPEVEQVFGKAGRADTSTDPAPLSMMETTVLLKPQSEWPLAHRWYSSLPSFLQYPFTFIWSRHITWDEMVSQMDKKMQFPGTTNSWTMPIRNRIDMLTTGIRTPVGIKIMGSSLEELQKVGLQLEHILPKVNGTRSVFAERSVGGYYLNFHFNRERLARYGLSISQAQNTLMSAVGGASVSNTVEGRERYPITVRYARDFRSNIDSLKHVLLATPSGVQIPMGEVATLKMAPGPAMIRDENGRLASYVYVDVAGRDIGSYVAAAKKLVANKVHLPTGLSLTWSGQYENMARASAKLKVILPITLLIVLLLIYANTKSWEKTAIILSSLPFSAVGAIWILYLLHYNMSIAVWVGLIALLGVAAEIGTFMLLYLDLTFEDMRTNGQMNNFEDLGVAIYHGAVKRLRPQVMTVSCLVLALLPIMWASSAEAGADVMKRIAAPMLGGIITAFIIELIVYPAVFAIWKSRSLQRR